MTVLLRLFPPDWRRRYGEDVEEMLLRSRTPIRDRVDLVQAAVRCHLDTLDKEEKVRRLMVAGSAALVVVGAVSTSLAASQMTNGLIEVPQHWWAGLAMGPGVLGLVGLAVAWRRPRRRLA